MNQNEIRDRLLELARVRLKNRFGAFEQFRFTLDGLVEGSAILARASLLPAAWIAGFRLGLGEAPKQIDAHLLRIIDEWAQRESPVRQIPALEGVQPLPAAPPTETPSAAPVEAERASNAPDISKGTPPKLTEADKAEILRLYDRGRGASVNAMAKQFDVSRPTIEKVLQRAGIKK